MTNTVKQPEIAAQLEPLVGPWYSREDGASLVGQYVSSNVLAEVFWTDQLNAAFAKGRQVGDLTAKLWSLVGEWNARKSDITNDGAEIELEAAIGDLEDLLRRFA